MRLWHSGIIQNLPRQQLVSQWRECICIAKSICEKGTPNHILVNKIMNYPIDEFIKYCNIVLRIMRKRGYKVSESSIHKLENYVGFELDRNVDENNVYVGWHNDEYLQICLWNLYEKFLMKGISETEWNLLKKYRMKNLI